MQTLHLYCETLHVEMESGPCLADITDDLERMIAVAGITTGSLAACMAGSTGSLTTIEFEPGVVQDLKRAISRLAPRKDVYEHEKAWHDGNGHSHVQAALLGPSIHLPVRKGRLQLGTWQQAVAINHDARARSRRIEVTLIGSAV